MATGEGGAAVVAGGGCWALVGHRRARQADAAVDGWLMTRREAEHGWVGDESWMRDACERPGVLALA